ncbi:MAG: DNA-binding response regulator [Phycisphaerales bacterium]|nr:MAG: DNA-binding response regulator [Phycisphaerales bacterium]
MPLARVLIIEDEAAIRDGVREALQLAGYATREAPTGQAALDTLGDDADGFDLVLLDVLMPGLDGFGVLDAIRRERPTLPVIMLTALDAEADRVRGLRGGADDYVVKPFGAGELIARVEAVLRRSPARPKAVRTVELPGGARFDAERRELTPPGPGAPPVPLPELEAALLAYLIAHADRAVTREELLRSVWRLDPRGVRTRTVDMAVLRVREALRGVGVDAERVVRTVRGAGYVFGDPTTDADS